jgi:Tfp pilus assembly protein PilF
MQQPGYFTFGIQAETPPLIDLQTALQRTDEFNALIDLLGDARTRTVLLTGAPGVGKSTLAALTFGQLQDQVAEGLLNFRHYIWLRLGPRTTWPDVSSALLNALQPQNRADRKISQRSDLQTLYETLCRPGQGALVVLDQCEEIFERAIDAQNQSMPYTVGTGLSSTVRFLEMLQQDLGESRFLLTCTRSPYGSDYRETPGVREFVIGGLTIVEGINLLQQHNVHGLQQDLSTVWQRCSGHLYSLLMFGALKNLSGLSLHYLLNSRVYQIIWEGNISQNLLETVVGFFNPVQTSMVRALCLFKEPATITGIMEVARGEQLQLEIDTPLFEQEIQNFIMLGLLEQIHRPDGETSYMLHPVLNQYILNHYLESEQKRSSNYFSASSLGVANQPSPMQASEESRQNALAAGHIRMVSYYRRAALQTCPPHQQRSHPNEVTPWLAMLDHLCLGRHWQIAYEQLCALGLDEDLMRWEMWHTLIKLYETTLPPAGTLNRRDEGLVCSALGMVYSKIGEYDQSRTYYTSALAIQRDMDDQQSEAITLTNQGEFLRGLGDREMARQNFEQAQSLLQPQSSPELTCVLLHNMALLAQEQKNYQQSARYFIQSLQLARQSQNQERESLILTNLGLLLCEQGRYQDGMALLLPALQMRHAYHDPGIDALIAFLSKLEQRMGNETFAHLRQAAQTQGSQEQILHMLAAV